MSRGSPPSPCPCGSARTLEQCCKRWMPAGDAPDAESLMRSRYTAYALRDEAYLLATWHPNTRPDALGLSEPSQPKWLGLKVLRHEPVDTDHARVEFVARYSVGGRAHRLHETSRFERISGRWYYLDGQFA